MYTYILTIYMLHKGGLGLNNTMFDTDYVNEYHSDYFQSS